MAKKKIDPGSSKDAPRKLKGMTIKPPKKKKKKLTEAEKRKKQATSA
jgi:hypothetical protein